MYMCMYGCKTNPKTYARLPTDCSPTVQEETTHMEFQNRFNYLFINEKILIEMENLNIEISVAQSILLHQSNLLI